MRSLSDFQNYYGITDTETAKIEYQRYLEALELFKRIEERREAQGPEYIECMPSNSDAP